MDEKLCVNKRHLSIITCQISTEGKNMEWVTQNAAKSFIVYYCEIYRESFLCIIIKAFL